jgi:alpha/beta superfamily hydrolase
LTEAPDNKKGFTQKDLFYPVGNILYEFLDLNGEQIYFICHEPAHHLARATVIIARPFGHERTCAYLTLTRWARFLAISGIRAVAFDYRGCGESSGSFEDFTFKDWEEDFRSIIGICQERFPGNIIILSGLRFGGILASRAFSRQLGDALLLWNSADSAHSLLREILRLKLSIEASAEISAEKPSRPRDIADLESNHKIYVLGQFWTPRLRDSSFLCTLKRPDENEVRPWIEIRFNSHTMAQIPDNPHIINIQKATSPFWNSLPTLNPDVDELFIQSRNWILNVINTIEKK